MFNLFSKYKVLQNIEKGIEQFLDVQQEKAPNIDPLRFIFIKGVSRNNNLNPSQWILA